MLKNLEEFKQFVEWAKEAGLSAAKIGEFSFEISQVTQVEMYSQKHQEISLEQEPDLKDELDNPRAQYIRDSKEEDIEEDILFHSSR